MKHSVVVGNSTVVPVRTASTKGVNARLRWSRITFCCRAAEGCRPRAYHRMFCRTARNSRDSRQLCGECGASRQTDHEEDHGTPHG